MLGEELGSNLPPIWGLDTEGELRGAWRELSPLKNIWVMVGTCGSFLSHVSFLISLAGNLAWSRVFSKFLALRRLFAGLVCSTTDAKASLEIKAKQEGIFGGRYSKSPCLH